MLLRCALAAVVAGFLSGAALAEEKDTGALALQGQNGDVNVDGRLEEQNC